MSVGRNVVPLRRELLTRRRDEEIAFLPAALEIVERPPSPIGRAVGATIMVFFGIALVWSCLGQVGIVATAPGKIVPSGRSKVIQPFEIGVVRAIHVEDGQTVKAGDVLIELDPTINDAERRHAQSDLIAAQLDIARLQAALSDDPDPVTAFHPPQQASAVQIVTQRQFLITGTSEQHAKLAALDRQLSEKEAERATSQATINKIEALIPLLQQQVDIRKILFDHETGSRLLYLQTLQTLVEQQQELLVQKSHYREADAAAAAIMASRDQAAEEYRRTHFDDLVKAEAKSAGLAQELVKAEERTQLQRLTAPIDGVVQQLAVYTVGGVVTPAQALLVIVPTDTHLEIQARISNRDIGFVRAGQQVDIKIDTFPYTRYGLLHGEVESISADAVTSDEREDKTSQKVDAGAKDIDDAAAKEPVYQARISFSPSRMEIDEKMIDLQPGMAVTAEIETGSRRIIGYLLSPLLRYEHEALRER
jgi:hemolysin D